MIPITNTPVKDRLYMQCARSELDQTTQFDACAKWVEESAQLWMHRPRAGWPPELREAYEAIHDASDANGSVYARLKWWKDRADDDADEIQRLRDEVKDLKVEIENLKVEIEKMDKEIENLEAEIEKMDKEIQSLSASL